MNVADDWREHAARLACHLADQGLDERWVSVFARVPRHVFVDGGRLFDDDGTVPDAQSWDHDQLLREAYTDQVVVTRFETVDGERVATSSASQPAIMATMLRLLDVDDDSRVLEIGTGPGYNAALLCTRLGDQRVTSVDIQDDLVDAARRRLAHLGFHPRLEAGDGSAGCPDRAPFDRIIATCGLSRIPSPWLDQLAPGARIVAPMNFGGALAVLDRRHDGTVTGRFPADAGFFMELRHPGDPAAGKPPGYLAAPPREFTAAVDLDALGDLDFRLWLELGVPGARVRPLWGLGGETVEVEITTPDARLRLRADDEVRVSQYGAPVWPAIETLLRQWDERGRPQRTSLGMTVTPHRQWAWLDDEDSHVVWRL